MRFGRRRFRLLTLPGRTGGHLSAELDFSHGVHATGAAQCTLHCIDMGLQPDTSLPGAQADSLVSVYREAQELDTAGRHIRALRVEFEIPPDVPGTRLRESPRIFWRLAFRIPAKGPDYQGDFLVPVYAPEMIVATGA